MTASNGIVSEDHPDFIGPFEPWNPEHLKIVKGGKESILKWRKENPNERLMLNHATLRNTNLSYADLRNAKLYWSTLLRTELQGADLSNASLNNAFLVGANLSRTNLTQAKLKNAKLQSANLKEAELHNADLREAKLWAAHLNGAKLLHAKLHRADLRNAVLLGTNFQCAELFGTEMSMAIVDGTTTMSDIKLDDSTDMTGVGLGNIRMEPHTRSHLEYNIRKIGWKKQFKKNLWLKIFLWPFLAISDYGYSTKWLLACFFGFAFLFAGIYLIPTQAPGWIPESLRFECAPLITDLDTVNVDGKTHSLSITATWVRAFYFSVVTMTTLGFGDIHAHPLSIPGHILLMLQVTIGYGLLGALITRLAILFQSVEG